MRQISGIVASGDIESTGTNDFGTVTVDGALIDVLILPAKGSDRPARGAADCFRPDSASRSRP